MNYQNEIVANYYFARFNEILFYMEREMLITGTTGNITIDFIRCMVPYNTGIIYMCENFLKYTQNNNLKSMSNSIIEMKKREINYMQDIYNNIIPFMNTEKEVNSYFKKYFKIVNNMINSVRNIPMIININIDFINEMIHLYQGETKICQNLLRYNIDPRIRNLTNSIIIENNNIIGVFKQVEYNIKNNMI